MLSYFSNINKSTFAVLISFYLAVVLTGCTERSLDVRGDTRVHFRITDLLSGVDISSTGEVESLDVFFFDQNMNFQKHQGLSASEIKSNAHITLNHANVNGWWVSVWGNLKDGQIRPIPLMNNPIDGLAIRLKESLEKGYYNCPDDLFFGIARIDQSNFQSGINRIEIPITRKNGRLHITVRGLAQDIAEDDYYFTVKGNHVGYNMLGVPVSGEVDIKQAGKIQDTDFSFATPEAFNVIHTMDNLFMTINLYQVSQTRAVSLLASVTEDGKGNSILPLAGQTTNVLLNMQPGGEVEVYVEITPWGENYQWSRW